MSRLLIVDDEQDICRLYAAELADEGYQVETAGSAATAIELLTKRDFDLVVLDIQMRGESGLQVLQEIVRDKPELPVILCSAFSCYKDDFSSWLADAYVVKSSDTGVLKTEISRVLDKRKVSNKQ
jgi:DNA-binding NtrC family response regulator